MWNHNYVFIAIFFSLNLFSQKYDKTVFDLVSKYENEIISLRHWFHENAELSNREFLTSEKIAEELKKIGLSPQTGIAKTGVVALLKGGKPGRVVPRISHCLLDTLSRPLRGAARSTVGGAVAVYTLM